MGSDPLLGFGRVYAASRGGTEPWTEGAPAAERAGARPFHYLLRAGSKSGGSRSGAPPLTRSRTRPVSPRGKATGPIAVLPSLRLAPHPVRLYQSYMACLTVPRRVAEAADRASLLLDDRTPRAGDRGDRGGLPGPPPREHPRTGTLRGTSRVGRLGKLWEEWTALGVHLVEEGWKAPSGFEVFTDSGTYAPTFLIGSWADEAEQLRMLSLRRLCRHGRSHASRRPRGCAGRRRLDDGLFPELHFPRRRGEAHGARPRRAGFRAESLRGAGRAGRRRGSSRLLRGGDPRGESLERPDGPARPQARRLRAREKLAGAGVDRLHLRRPVHRNGGRHARRRRGLPGEHEARRAPGLEPHRLHLPADGAAREGAPRLQPSSRPLHVGRGPHDAPGEDLRLGPDPQRAADDALPGGPRPTTATTASGSTSTRLFSLVAAADAARCRARSAATASSASSARAAWGSSTRPSSSTRAAASR